VIRRALVLAVIAAVAALVVTGVSSAKLYAKCVPNVVPGTAIEKERKIQIFCGTATATVRQTGVTRKFTPGMCLRYPNVLIVGVGKLTTLRPGKGPLYKAFYVAFPALKDGTYKKVTARYQVPGRQIAFQGTFKVSGKRSRATFNGRVVRTDRPGLGVPLSGSFTCK
jgi:hypothetical protein